MDTSSIRFNDIFTSFSELADTNRIWIAYSGGLDSTVLLHLVSVNREQLGPEIIAVHVNHQISKNSVFWENHCKEICKRLDVKLKIIEVDATTPKGTGLEAHARQLRYAAIEKLMKKNDILLTAHHQNDLAETFILQLMRGSGPEGLAGMPLLKSFGEGYLIRPLLGYLRKDLEIYARENRLEWIEDESNLNTDFDRNYVRNNIITYLEKRWPSAIRTIARSAEHQTEVIDILKEVAASDFEGVRGESTDYLNLIQFNHLSNARKKNLLRYWIRLNSHSLPGKNIMEHVLSGVINSRKDKIPMVRWNDSEIRRYRDKIYIIRSRDDINNESYTWNLGNPLTLDCGILQAKQVTGKGIRSSSIVDNIIEVRFRTGGEKIHPVGRRETHKLKKLFQETGIPPWQREQIPLLYIDNQLAAVTGYWIDEKFNTGSNESGWVIYLTEYQ